jgi:hypothetical protein
MREKRVAVLVALWLLNVPAGHTEAGETESMRAWQLGLLFNPGEHQLQLERKGRVVIYDNLNRSDIDRAFAEQFDRVENMMFVSTHITDEQGDPVRDRDTGEAMIEDDGCD